MPEIDEQALQEQTQPPKLTGKQKFKKILNGAKKATDEAMTTLDAALTILNNYPETENDITFSYTNSFNPSDLLLNILKKTVGYDWIVKILGGIIAAALPFIEAAMKTAMLVNLKNIFSCTINPIITEDIIKEGIVFNLNDVDLSNIMRFSPLWRSVADNSLNVGRFYYFGCCNMRYASELENAGDFNAFLWYVKNKAIERTAWRGVDIVESILPVEKKKNDPYNYETALFNSTLLQKVPKEPRTSLDKKDKKESGILTLEYNESPNSLTDYKGNKLENIQTPTNGNIHIFVGNTTPIYNPDVNYKQYTAKIEETETSTYRLYDELNNLKSEKTEQERAKGKLKKKDEDYKTKVEKFDKAIKELDKKIKEIEKKIKGNQTQVKEFERKVKQLSGSYKDYKLNYYYGRTLMELNYDYIMSLRLLDPVVVAAQLFDNACDCLRADVQFSYIDKLVENEVEKILESIVNAEDIIVSDCFFSFSNKDYDEMLQNAELSKLGLYNVNGKPTTNKQVGSDVLNTLNTINENTTLNEIQTVIESSLFSVSRTISETETTRATSVNASVTVTFIDQLMKNLTIILTKVLISPKVYLLLAFNLKVVGQWHPFQMPEVLIQERALIGTLVKQIHDFITEYLVKKVKEILMNLSKEVAALIAQEQIQYYKQYYEKCVQCFKYGGARTDTDFDVDKVDYADIFETPSTQEENNEC